MELDPGQPDRVGNVVDQCPLQPLTRIEVGREQLPVTIPEGRIQVGVVTLADVIEPVLKEDETDERATLRELVERKRKQTKYQDTMKLMQFLARQGFNYDDIKAVLAEAE